jgi:hypothetical protein
MKLFPFLHHGKALSGLSGNEIGDVVFCYLFPNMDPLGDVIV